MLTENRQVIGVDLHGHGRTELGDRPIDLVDMGRDMGLSGRGARVMSGST
jgi:hypothetical protein